MREDPPHEVKRPLMFQGWERLTFLHWRYPVETIRSMLPRGLELDTFDASAWVGLTPFVLTRLRFPGIPALPRLSQFPEMNVRTYVQGPDGQRGIWFFTLEAQRLPAVMGARLLYGLPYRWAKMQVRARPDHVEYRSDRYFGSGHAEIRIGIGPRIVPNEQLRFLTARFRLYALLAGRLIFSQVEHPVWPLHEATVLHLQQNVIEHSGLVSPSGEPLVHFSPGVYVRIGRPKLVGADAIKSSLINKNRRVT